LLRQARTSDFHVARRHRNSTLYSKFNARIVALGFFLHVRVLSRLFRRLFIEGLLGLHRAGDLAFLRDLSNLTALDTFTSWLAPLRKKERVVDAKSPFGGPGAVLAYLSRYTRRVAISNSRIVSADSNTVAFRWKDYRIATASMWIGRWMGK